jgi:hypothetical protein
LAIRIKEEPVPLGDALAYSRLPARAIYHRTIIEETNHVYGLCSRVLKPLQTFTGGRRLGMLSALHNEFGEWRITRSETTRALVIDVSLVIRSTIGVYDVYAKPTFSEWDGTDSETQAEQQATAAPADPAQDRLGLEDPLTIAGLSRPRYGGGSAGIPAVASFRFLPQAAISEETRIVLSLRAAQPIQVVYAGYVTGITVYEEPVITG